MIVADSLALADKFTLRIDDSSHKEFTDHINDTGTAKSHRFGSRVTYNFIRRLHGLFVNGTCLNGAVCGTHTAADVSTLKGRTCGTCTAHHEIGITEHQLSVGTKVDKQRKFRSVPDHTYQCTGSDISTYIASDIRSHDNMCIRIDLNSHIRCKQRICFEKCRNIRFHTKGIRINPCKQMIHCCIGSNTHPVDLLLRKMNASAHLMDHRVNGLFDHRVLKFLLSTRFLRLDDTVDNIRTKTNLSVSGRTLGQDLSCFHIDQNC